MNQSNTPPTPGESLVHRALEFLPALLLSPFIVLFLVVAFGRLTTPFELEWNEGQNSIQAWRFSQGMSLYPEPESGWVPYMYAPFFHQVVGALFWVSGVESLAWGRLVSLLSTVATLIILVILVYHHTRRFSLALLAPGLYASFFAASGFWFDLGRNDSLMIVFTLAGAGLVTHREPKRWHAWAALAFLCLATWTKQPVAPLIGLVSIYALARNTPGSKGAVLVVGAAFLNLLLIYPYLGNPYFFHYVVSNALNHASDFSAFVPSALNFPYDQNPITGGLLLKSSYWAAAWESPPRVWVEVLSATGVWLLVLGVGFLILLPRLKDRKNLLPATLAILLFGWSLWASVGAYTKYGGYNNNWMPFFLCLSALVPVGVWPLFNHSYKCRVLACLGLGCFCVITLITQLYNPFNQLPTAEDYTAHDLLIAELREKHEAGESIWVAHHEWYALKTGHPILYNWDMVRCATYAGDPVPTAFTQAMLKQSTDWILLNSESLEYEWAPVDAELTLLEAYEPAGLVEGSGAMQPVAGARQRPVRWYARKSESLF